jgi:hypothetical protein
MLKSVVVVSSMLGGCHLMFPLSEPAQNTSVDAPPDAPERVARLTESPFTHGLQVTAGFAYVTTSNFEALTNTVERVDLSTREVVQLTTGEVPISEVRTTDDQSVYWTTWDPMPEIRTLKIGEDASPRALVGLDSPGFAINAREDGRVFAPLFGNGKVYEVGPSSAELSTTLTIGTVNTMGVTKTVFRDGQLFWTNQRSGADGGVFSIAEGDPSVVTWAIDNQTWGLVVTPEHIVYSRKGATLGTSSIVRVTRNDLSSVVLATGHSDIRGLALDGNDLYYAEQVPDGGIWRVPLDMTAAAVEVVPDQQRPLNVVVVGEDIYWTCNDPIFGGLYRAAKN